MEKLSSYHNTAVRIIEIYDTTPSKADEILSEHFFIITDKRPFQSICQFIFLTVLRNKFLIEHTIQELSTKKPRKKLNCLLQAAIAELLFTEENRHPKVIHSWVEYAKKVFSMREAQFINALLRKAYAKVCDIKNGDNLSIIYSMPSWLINRWINFFGKEKTIEILKICNKASEVFFRKSPSSSAEKLFENYSQYFIKSEFEHFYILKSGNWQNVKDLINTKHFYIQDPSTSFAVKSLKPEVNKTYLDLCASPGGKSRTITDFILANAIDNNKESELKDSLLVSVDVSSRAKKLRENLSVIDYLSTEVVECDLLSQNLAENLAEKKLPLEFDGVFIDAPCSNTGVLRRRPDARYRISEKDIFECKKIQLELLNKCAKFVKNKGTLVFSTCSIDFEENEQNAKEFLEQNKNFKFLDGKTFLPTNQSDGCGYFCFVKS